MGYAEDRAKAVESALSQIEKQFGKGSIMRLGAKDAIVPISVISTGSISFDAALGVGGVPRGRVIEIFGPESSGKTTITLQIIAEAQRAGRDRIAVHARTRIAHPHHGALAELPLDLGQCTLQGRLPLGVGLGVGRADGCYASLNVAHARCAPLVNARLNRSR